MSFGSSYNSFGLKFPPLGKIGVKQSQLGAVPALGVKPGVASPDEAKLGPATLGQPSATLPEAQLAVPAPAPAPGLSFVTKGGTTSFDPSNPANSYENRTSPENKAWDESRLSLSKGTGPAASPADSIYNPAQTLTPDPAQQLPRIGIPSPSQVTAATKIGMQVPQAGPSAVNFGRSADAYNAARGSYLREAQKSHAAGDIAGMNLNLARHEALQAGGYAAVAHLDAQHGLNQANINHLNYQPTKVGGELAKLPNGNVDPNSVYQSTLRESNDASKAEEASANQRINNLLADHSRGQQVAVAPGDANRVLGLRGGHLAPFLSVDENSGAPKQDLVLALSKIAAADPSLLSNPESPLGQAVEARIRQMYPGDVGRQINIGEAPPLPVLGGSVGSPLDMMATTGNRAGAGLGNLIQGRGVRAMFNPETDFQERNAADQLWRAFLGGGRR